MPNDPTVNGVKFHGDDRADSRGLDQYAKLAGALTASVGSSALTSTITQIRAAAAQRREISLQNIGSADLEIGFASNFTTARWLADPRRRHHHSVHRRDLRQEHDRLDGAVLRRGVLTVPILMFLAPEAPVIGAYHTKLPAVAVLNVDRSTSVEIVSSRSLSLVVDP